MPTPAKSLRPIFIIKKKVSHFAHHGGAWKVAYADFVTAMMSLFIVLWLLNTSPQIKKAVAGYFNDPRSSGKQTGTLTLGSGESISIDKQNVEKLKEEIERAILKQADLTKLSKQIDITVTGEGLKIDLIEDKGGTFFESGSPKLSDNGVSLLNLLSAQLKVLPNHLLIEGHTDAQPYPSQTGYTNWELSSDRANSARRLLQQDGIGSDHISQVRGYADQMLRVPTNPYDPSNRRISLIVQWVDANPLQADTSLNPTGRSDVDPTKGRTVEDKTSTSPARDDSPHSEGNPEAKADTPPVRKLPPSAAPRHMWITRLGELIPESKK